MREPGMNQGRVAAATVRAAPHDPGSSSSSLGERARRPAIHAGGLRSGEGVCTQTLASARCHQSEGEKRREVPESRGRSHATRRKQPQ